MNTKDVKALLDLFHFPLPRDADFGREFSALDVEIATREAAIAHLMNMTLQCLGAIRTLVVESEEIRISCDSTDIDGTQRDSGNAQHLQRQVFAQAVNTMTSTIVVARELDHRDPIKTLVESFPWKPNLLSNQWLMLQWQLMDLPSIDDVQDEENENHRHYLSMTKDVVRYYPHSLSEIDKFGQHYLYYAIQSQSLPALRLFLRYHPKILHLADHHGRLPIHYVVMYGQQLEAVFIIAEQMQRGLDDLAINLRDGYGNSLLHLASGGEGIDSIQQEILFAYPEGVKVKNNDGQLPLHVAAGSARSVKKCQRLFSAYPQAISWADNRGLMPLHQAAMSNAHIDIHRYLWQCYPDAMKIPLPMNGRIPLHYATVKCLSTPILRWMLEVYPHGARVMDSNQRLALHNLIARCPGKGLAWTPLRLQCLRVLLEAYPIAASFRDRSGSSPLDLAKRDGHGDLVLRLLLRADPKQDPEGLAEITYLASKAKFKREEKGRYLDAEAGRASRSRRKALRYESQRLSHALVKKNQAGGDYDEDDDVTRSAAGSLLEMEDDDEVRSWIYEDDEDDDRAGYAQEDGTEGDSRYRSEGDSYYEDNDRGDRRRGEDESYESYESASQRSGASSTYYRPHSGSSATSRSSRRSYYSEHDVHARRETNASQSSKHQRPVQSAPPIAPQHQHQHSGPIGRTIQQQYQQEQKEQEQKMQQERVSSSARVDSGRSGVVGGGEGVGGGGGATVGLMRGGSGGGIAMHSDRSDTRHNE